MKKSSLPFICVLSLMLHPPILNAGNVPQEMGENSDDPGVHWDPYPYPVATWQALIISAAAMVIGVGGNAILKEVWPEDIGCWTWMGRFGTISTGISAAVLAGQYFFTYDQGYAASKAFAPTQINVVDDPTAPDCRDSWNNPGNDMSSCSLGGMDYRNGPAVVSLDDGTNAYSIPLFNGAPRANYSVGGPKKIHPSPGFFEVSKRMSKRIPTRNITDCEWRVSNYTVDCDLDAILERIPIDHPGNYSVILAVSDAAGAEAFSEAQVVQFENVGPDLRLLCDFSNKSAFPITLACLAIAAPYGVGVTIEDIQWQLNGKEVVGERMNKLRTTYQDEGFEKLILTATDSHGLSTARSYQILVNPRDRVAVIPASGTDD